MTVLGLLGGFCFASDDNLQQRWVEEYYQGNSACTVASIDAITLSPHQVKVTLDVEQKTSEALATSEPKHRDNWMALHCPPENHQAWKQNIPDFDVMIIATLASIGQYEFSCASHHVFERKKRNSTAGGVLSRLRLLLNNSMQQFDDHDG